MDNDFFADKNWPYKLELSGAIVSSPFNSLNDNRFLNDHYFHHLPTALAALLALPPENFDQTIIPAAPPRPLYQRAAIVATGSGAELFSLYSVPMSAAAMTRQQAGLYLQLEALGATVATRYNLPLQQLSGYDPSSIRIPVASYVSGDAHTLRPDPQLAGLISRLKGGPLTSKDRFQLHTAYYGQFGGFTMEISHYFDSYLHALSGLLHHPTANKIPPMQRTIHMTAKDTVLSNSGSILATVAYLPRNPWDQAPPRGFYLCLPKPNGKSSLDLDLTTLPIYSPEGAPYYQLATLEGGRPQELPAFTQLKNQVDRQLRSTTKRTLRHIIAHQAKRVLAGLGGSKSP
ncbi:hypothetical protein DCC81_03590 [Chitinophaga parva]|uniref:Uncharacterized protein n=1 Tax=Chitinophaga parva TaxID=2169414 RepID=A0A2T7BLP4_9BACT|nr:hypothetical protein [Chitinophaga parva]PUZ28576.1 hypothetical protein DCC81_03590 [Chitinophaga parva]